MNNRERQIEFDDGVFKDYLLSFIRHQQNLGLKYGYSTIYTLRSFNKVINKMNPSEPCLTKTMVESLILRLPDESTGSQQRRATLIRQFAIYMNSIGLSAYLLPKQYIPKQSRDYFMPYIFSEDEISSIIATADSLKPMSRYPRYHQIYPALLRVLCGCGLRLSEVRFLKTEHVNLKQGILYIEKSKNNTSRYVPMATSLTVYLRKYVQNLNIHFNNSAYFFAAPDGGPYYDKTLRGVIRNIYKKAGIKRLSNGHLPRVHDLRHSFSVHAIKQMKANGQDLYVSIPLLSTYLGHTNTADTEKYIHLTDFEFSNFVADSSKLLSGVIPEVSFNEPE